MTEIQKYRAEYGPTRLGMTRLLLAMVTLAIGEWLASLFVNQSWNTPGMTYLTAIGGFVVGVGCAVVSSLAAWAWMGFQNPVSFIKRVWRMNYWNSDFAVHCWLLQEGAVHFQVVHKYGGLTVPAGYSIMVPLSGTWNSPFIYDWVSCAPLGKIVTDLSIRVVVARPERFQYEADMVWLQDKFNNRILVTLEEALEWWIPETLKQIVEPSLAITLRKTRKIIDEKAAEIAKERRMTELCREDSRRDQEKSQVAYHRILAICTRLGEFLGRVQESRRLKFNVEFQPIFEGMKCMHDALHQDPLGTSGHHHCLTFEKKPFRADIRGDLA